MVNQKARDCCVITYASAGERVGDFPTSVVVSRAASEAADDYRAGWDSSEAAGREKPDHDNPAEIAGPSQAHH
jgi:hypothetical protein